MIQRDEFISRLTAVFSKNKMGGMLTKAIAEKFCTLTEFMLAENEKFNLTAITDPDKIILSHYLDCATLAGRVPKGATLADIGSGAGFPTLPLSILRSDLTIVSIDSTAKRTDYVARAAALLDLSNVTTVTMRAEDGGKSAEYREKFDVVTARAVAEMRVLAELCLPYVKRGGELLAMKGKNAEFELRDAKRAITMLGGRDARIEEVVLTDGTEVLSHPLITVRKAERTPPAYPRVYAQISKKPL